MSDSKEELYGAENRSPNGGGSMKGVYGALALFVLGAVLLMGFASNTKEQKEESDKIPKEITHYSDCEVTSKSAIMIGGVIWDIIETSCGPFHDPLIFEMEKGKVYDLEVEKLSFGQSHIIKVTPSSDG